MRALVVRRLVPAVAVMVPAAAVWLLAPGLLGSNFHVVVPGRVYRSGQLAAAELETIIARYRLRTIVNLRGARPGSGWYDAERAVAARHGVRHYDLDLPVRRLPPQPALAALVEILQSAPTPLLLHCGAGADRAGLASAVARLLDGASLAAARAELALAYGHFRLSPAGALGRVLDGYAAFLAATEAPEGAATFRRWVREEYVPYGYRARLEVVAFPTRAAPASPMALRVRATNTSPAAWRLSPSRLEGIKLGVRIRRVGEARWRDFDRTGYTARRVQPGAVVEFVHSVVAPEVPGRYEIKLDLVDEYVTWFEDQGSEPIVLPLEVVGSRSVG
jgi:protein tyrosine phosphatase (PTP) superfamily phosphohydrolase (DUF442 family)